MTGLPFALALSDRFGRHDYVATFREAADLWTFYGAWRGEVSDDSARGARFVHIGRAVRTITPTKDEESLAAWARECAERDKR